MTNLDRYPSLDGLRTYAVIGIVLMHVLANVSIKPTRCFLTENLIPYLTNGVYLFMMVSAFSLSCGYYERIKNGTITPNSFYTKRYFRIWPFFSLMVAIDLFLEHGFPQIFEAFANLTLCFNFLPYPHMKVIGVGWFLGLIFMFYISFPFFVFLVDNKKRAIFVLIISLLFSGIAASYFSSSEFVLKPIDRIYLVFSAPFFIVGGIIYLYRIEIYRIVSQSSSYFFTICIIFSILRVIVKIPETIILPDLLLFSSWLIYTIGSPNKVLNNRLVRYLSGISMEIYLCHMMFFRLTDLIPLHRITTNGDALYALTCLLTLGGAIFFSHAIKFMIFPRIKWLKLRSNENTPIQ